MNVLKKIKF